MPEWVTDRVEAVTDFYNSADIETTRAFLGKYDVRYIVVGQLERAEYTSEGISKFEQYNGVFWKLVYSDVSTVIYEVIS